VSSANIIGSNQVFIVEGRQLVYIRYIMKSSLPKLEHCYRKTFGRICCRCWKCHEAAVIFFRAEFKFSNPFLTASSPRLDRHIRKTLYVSPGQYLWDLWCTKKTLRQDFLRGFRFPLLVLLHRCSTIFTHVPPGGCTMAPSAITVQK
jgi:hypothetical protein